MRADKKQVAAGAESLISTGVREASGFSLIELSIVLVIIGLIVGSVLAGQSLIGAAKVRATITQIEKYNTATNTFRNKYGYLPGDIKDPEASSFGFAARGGGTRGQGDGNGVLEGVSAAYCSGCYGVGLWGGEIPMFWVDLSAAHLIDDTFNTATSTTNINSASTPPSALYPLAKVGQGNYVLIESKGSLSGTWQSSGINYFVIQVLSNSWAAAPGLTVQQAFAIDNKMDDGLPLSGKLLASYYNPAIYFQGNIGAAAVSAGMGSTPGSATPGAPTSCYDNGNDASNMMVYSIEITNGSNVNCALIFEFQ